jgi:hypothetical protein
MFLSVVSAASTACRLQHLTELMLSAEDWTCPRCNRALRRIIHPLALIQGLKMMLPLRLLRTLEISVAPTFLDILDLQWFRGVAEALPALESLYLGHRELARTRQADMMRQETTPLCNIVIFCTLLSTLRHLELTSLALRSIENLDLEWQCVEVKTVVAHQ